MCKNDMDSIETVPGILNNMILPFMVLNNIYVAHSYASIN